MKINNSYSKSTLLWHQDFRNFSRKTSCSRATEISWAIRCGEGEHWAKSILLRFWVRFFKIPLKIKHTLPNRSIESMIEAQTITAATNLIIIIHINVVKPPTKLSSINHVDSWGGAGGAGLVKWPLALTDQWQHY